MIVCTRLMSRYVRSSESDAAKLLRKAGRQDVAGYHRVEIQKGILGESSKIQEELDELQDAEKQGVKILIHCELADLYGALQAIAERHDLTMDDLRRMADLTKKAFEVGQR